MEEQVITRVRAILPDGVAERATVVLRGGRIHRIVPHAAARSSRRARQVDGGGGWLAPGFLDLHIHGLLRWGADGGVASIRGMARALPRYGVTGFLPTLAPASAPLLLQLIRSLAGMRRARGAQVLGIHVEGPWVALQGALPGRRPLRANQHEADDWLAGARGRLLVVTVSPEVQGICDLIRRLTRGGARVFLSHTRASTVETQAAIEAGARHATHFYDVFPAPRATEPGVRPCGAVEEILADERVSVDFILDGVHVEPAAIRAALACKGPERVCLITDAQRGAGLPPGRYRFGKAWIGFERPGGPARLIGRAGRLTGLAGSGLTMDQAVRNAVAMLKVEVPVAVRMASLAPARVLGLETRKGCLTEGFDADVVLLNERLEVERTWVGGRCEFRRGGHSA